MELPIGRAFDCRFGPFVPRLQFLSETSLQLDIPTPDGSARQVVATAVTPVRQGIFMLSWTEADGTTVVHTQDFETNSVHSHARLPDGTLVRSQGTITWVA
jgi:hypothetical protein